MTKEGAIFPLPFYVIAIVLFYIFHQNTNLLFLYLSAAIFYLGLLVMLFFRDPERKCPEGDGLILSPADGKIVRIENECENPSLSIFLGIHNVHVNRSPVDGMIKSVTFYPGKFMAAYKAGASKENQRNDIEIETKIGVVKFCQITGAIARRTIFNKKPGQVIKAGERVGLIRFGSRVDLILPAGAMLSVKIGQKVRAGETILGKLW